VGIGGFAAAEIAGCRVSTAGERGYQARERGSCTGDAARWFAVADGMGSSYHGREAVSTTIFALSQENARDSDTEPLSPRQLADGIWFSGT